VPKKIIFVADAFLEDINGGAELTTEALIESSPHQISKVYCRQLNKDYITNNKDCFWIFGNFASLTDEVKTHFIKNENYSVIEYDYKYCKYRSDDLHIKANGVCDCNGSLLGKLNSLFLFKSKCVWWMSSGQEQHYINNFPFLDKVNSHVLSSIFDNSTIKYFEDFSKTTVKKDNKWIVLGSKSWIKNLEGCKRYAEINDMEYDIVWGLKYEDLLKKISRSKGLLFLPLGKDTCPRITIEAKLLNCELILNNNVQHKSESWFKDKKSILNHMKERKSFFWKEISNYVHSF